eukprot:TRINITY_DN1497_c0_g1_i1.p1 TRINITY_DN1497_c0_g1~~TRINITY_DN1497_c0_g1_i1.p1  ORF type:complete len:272 (-),score=25.15 TRINITY_DN1497_c0_g1_i1:263-1078(-)
MGRNGRRTRPRSQGAASAGRWIDTDEEALGLPIPAGTDTSREACLPLGFEAGVWIHTPLGLEAQVLGARQGRLLVRYLGSGICAPLPFTTPAELVAHGYHLAGPARDILRRWERRARATTADGTPLRTFVPVYFSSYIANEQAPASPALPRPLTAPSFTKASSPSPTPSNTRPTLGSGPGSGSGSGALPQHAGSAVPFATMRSSLPPPPPGWSPPRTQARDPPPDLLTMALNNSTQMHAKKQSRKKKDLEAPAQVLRPIRLVPLQLPAPRA